MPRRKREVILGVLKRENREITTSDLANLTQINIKNISKYTKPLVKQKLIGERPEQDGKRRIKYYSLITELNPESIMESPGPIEEVRLPEELNGELQEEQAMRKLELFKKALEFAQNIICDDCQQKLEPHIKQLKKRINELLTKKISSY